MNTSTLRESDYFLARIIFFFAALIGGAIVGFFAGAMIGVILAGAGASKGMIQIAGAIAGFILSLPISYVCFRLSVGKFIVQKIEAASLVEPGIDGRAPDAG
jgi:hypothetical protein